ncbi:siphovirus ReqiPepy6 Gp37-like family protein [Streptomyces sp. NPDC096198]|uniref:siphovirus ReqiPepy6 Gp37-like family protein n=1 Tax=Streptomyces sp. NPDC096198 TaxID=3366080 RepID=UPI0037FB5954
MGYRVFVRDRPGQDGTMPILGEIDTWIKLDFTIRFNQPGAWQMLVKVGTPHERLLKEGRGIVIYQDGVPAPIFSGPIDAFEKYWTVDQHTGAGSVFVGGKCDNQIPFNYLAFPGVEGEGTDAMKLRPIAGQWEGADRRPAGAAVGQAIWVECDLAFGSRALPDRTLPGVSVGPNTPIGPAITDTLRYDTLGTKFSDWLKDKPFGYRFQYSPSSQRVELTVYACRDLGSTIRFAPELGNIKQFTWQLKSPTVTRAIVACQGEGKDRYIYQATDAEGEQQWGTVVEQFIDRRDIPLKTVKGQPELVVRVNEDKTEDIGQGPDGKPWPGKTPAEQKQAAKDYYVKAVQEAAQAALKAGEKNGHFQVYPIDTPQCQFGRDYYVGDIVNVEADGQTITDSVNEVTITVDDGGRVNTVTPKVGDQGTGEPLNLYKQVFEMREKLRKLEARM